MSPKYEPVDDAPQVTRLPTTPYTPPEPRQGAPAAPPRARRRAGRVQFNTQLLPDIRALLDQFVAEHDSTVQGVVEAALCEYLSARGVDVSAVDRTP